MAEIKEIDLRKRRALRTKQVLASTLRHQLRSFGDDIAGFAIVTWDATGAAQSGYSTSGPISPSLIPTFVHDCLNRHVAVVIAQDSASIIYTPDDEPA